MAAKCSASVPPSECPTICGLGQLSIDSSPDRGSDGQWVAGTRVIPGGTMTGIFDSPDGGQIEKLRRHGKP